MARIVSNPLDAVRQFSDVCQEIDSIGKVCVALPDLDPDAVLSQNFFSQEQLGSGVEVEIYSGDGKGLAVRNRLPDFADMKLFPIERLSDAYDQDPHVPIVLMDASTLHQRNVGLGRTDIVPHVVLDTHVSKEEVRAQRFAVVSDQHVATGSIITEYAKALFGDGHEVWADPEMRKNVAALRFGIHTDTGEGNYPTKRDRRADLFLEERQDGEYFEHLKNSLFFQKVKVIVSDTKPLRELLSLHRPLLPLSPSSSRTRALTASGAIDTLQQKAERVQRKKTSGHKLHNDLREHQRQGHHSKNM